MTKYRIIHIPTSIFEDIECSFSPHNDSKYILRNVKVKICDKLWMAYCNPTCNNCIWNGDSNIFSDNEFDIQEIE